MTAIARIKKGEEWAAYAERAAFDAAPVAALDALGKVLMEALRAAQERVEMLERRCAEIESKPSLEYLGVWTEGRSYTRGAVVTHSGSLWILHKAAVTLARPGTAEGAAAWTLAVKRGEPSKAAV